LESDDKDIHFPIGSVLAVEAVSSPWWVERSIF
jgi:hypothetical protein